MLSFGRRTVCYRYFQTFYGSLILPRASYFTSPFQPSAIQYLTQSTLMIEFHTFSISGVLKTESKVWSCNAIGFVCAIYYCFQFVKYLPKTKGTSVLNVSTPTLPGSVRQHMQSILAVIFGTLLVAITKPFANTANLLGNVAVLFCIAMFASPLSVLRQVLVTKSAKSIPLPFTIVSCLNCFMWTVYGWFRMRDVNIYLPNSLGLLCGLAQVALKLIFGDGENLPKAATPDIAP